METHQPKTGTISQTQIIIMEWWSRRREYPIATGAKASKQMMKNDVIPMTEV